MQSFFSTSRKLKALIVVGLGLMVVYGSTAEGPNENLFMANVISDLGEAEEESISSQLLDRDFDGLEDEVERYLGLDPALKDTDQDGFDDLDEILAGYSPKRADALLFDDLYDVPWLFDYVKPLVIRGIVRGTSDGLIEPSRVVKRAELGLMLMKSLMLDASFSEEDRWHEDVMSTVLRNGWTDQREPFENLTRLEAVYMIVEALDLPIIAFRTTGYQDVAKKDLPVIETARDAGIIKEASQFFPKTFLSRAETIKLVAFVSEVIDARDSRLARSKEVPLRGSAGDPNLLVPGLVGGSLDSVSETQAPVVDWAWDARPVIVRIPTFLTRSQIEDRIRAIDAVAADTIVLSIEDKNSFEMHQYLRTFLPQVVAVAKEVNPGFKFVIRIPGLTREELPKSIDPNNVQIGLDGSLLISSKGGDSIAWLNPFSEEVENELRSMINLSLDAGVDGVWLTSMGLPSTLGDAWKQAWPPNDDRLIQEFGELPSTEDWNDERFVRWVSFRQEKLADVIDRLRQPLLSKGLEHSLMVESWEGWNAWMSLDGLDLSLLADVSDLRVHHVQTAVSEARPTYGHWLRDVVRFKLFRDLDLDDPTWVHVEGVSGEAILPLFFTSLATGVMPVLEMHSDDLSSLNVLYNWLSDKSSLYMDVKRRPYAQVAVLISPESFRLYEASLASTMPISTEMYGYFMLLSESHIPYKSILPRELVFLDPAVTPILMIPHMPCMSDKTVGQISTYVSKGGRLFITGKSGERDDQCKLRTESLWSGFLKSAIFSSALDGTAYYRDVITGQNLQRRVEVQGKIVEGLKRLFPAVGIETTAPKEVLLLPFTEGDSRGFHVLNLANIEEDPRGEEQSYSLVLPWSDLEGAEITPLGYNTLPLTVGLEDGSPAVRFGIQRLTTLFFSKGR